MRNPYEGIFGNFVRKKNFVNSKIIHFLQTTVHTVKKYSACVLSCIFACVNWGHAVPLPNQRTRFEFQDFLCCKRGHIHFFFLRMTHLDGK